MCSICNIRDNPKCIEKPPDSQPCHGGIVETAPQSCAIIKVYNENGKALFIIHHDDFG